MKIGYVVYCAYVLTVYFFALRPAGIAYDSPLVSLWQAPGSGLSGLGSKNFKTSFLDGFVKSPI